MDQEMARIIETTPVLQIVKRNEETVWINLGKVPFGQIESSELSMADIDDAEDRLKRFAPFIMKCFPETQPQQGLIESALTPIPEMQALMHEKYGSDLPGKLLLKQDNDLAIAGSVKARGGIYEVLKHAESLALENKLIAPGDNYQKLASVENKDFFGQYTIQVGSTGNLGLSIGIMGAAVGFNVIVHMSADAKQWKKDLLRSHGVTVMEYEADYSEAVASGRRQSDENPKSYFVDDENSRDLFLGYAVAARRLAVQLESSCIAVDDEHPLFVYIPCGVGGAPGGITFGLKQQFGEHVHCFFVEPTQAPCMLVGMATGLNERIAVQDVGLNGLTDADGLAVARPSGFVGGVMKPLLSGIFTVRDANLYQTMRDLLQTERIFLEPSACAAFAGPMHILRYEESKQYIARHGMQAKMASATHIAWGTGGRLVPESIWQVYQNTYLDS